MNKKGFTLAELMGVIILMALLALIIIPVVDTQIKEGKKEVYQEAIDAIKSSLDLFMTDKKLNNNESMTITLYQLKSLGYVELDLKNPTTGKFFPNDMKIIIKNENGIISYDINPDTGSNIDEYKDLPKMVLNGNVLEHVELGEDYASINDVVSSYGGNSLETIMKHNIDTNKVGVYEVTYTATYDNITNKIIKNVVVRDTKGPVIEFNVLNISYSQIDDYDFTKDIVVKDASCNSDVCSSEEYEIKVETNFGALIGDYSIKYMVTDKNGNETIKYRIVKVS